MRTAIITALCAVSLSILFSSPLAAQSSSSTAQLPDALLHKLSLPLGLSPDLFRAESRSPVTYEVMTGEFTDRLLKDRAFARLKQDLQSLDSSSLPAVAGECGHILIYVPPITDTKMIIKVPENVANGQKAPTVKACGEDLRRVDAPRLAPPSAPGRNAGQSPLRDASFPR